MKTKTIMLILISSITLSCNRDSKSFLVKRNIIFDIGANLNYGDVYYDKSLKKDIVYFSNATTQHNIKFFNTAGELLQLVPLDSAIKNLDNIARVTIVSHDTIVINSNYTNELLIIDFTGRVMEKQKLASQLIDESGNQFEFTESVYPTGQTLSTLIYNCNWRANLNDVVNELVPNDAFAYLKYFNEHCYASPYFVTISNVFSDRPKIKYELYGIYQQICNEPSIFAEPKFYCFLDDRVFFYSMYSNKIFFVNAHNFKIERSVSIVSKKTKIGTSLLRLNYETSMSLQDSVTLKIKTSGGIVRILYNEGKREYYCIVRHASSVESYDKNQIPFSILLYTKDFVLKDEYVFDNFSFNCMYSLMTKDGLLLLRNDTTKTLKKNGKVTYSLLEFIR